MKIIKIIKTKELKDRYSSTRSRIEENGKIYYLDRLYKNGLHRYKIYRYNSIKDTKLDDVLGEYLVKKKREIDQYTQNRLEKETYLNLKTSKEKRVEIIKKELERAFSARWRADREGYDSRYDLANYDDYFSSSYFSKIENKDELYIEFLKCYLYILSDPFFYEDIPNTYEFIKSKCEEFGLLETFKKYYNIK